MPPQLPRSPAHLATGIRALQASSIILASTASGLSAAISFFVIPRILELPTHSLVRQFNRMIVTTGKVMPPLMILSTLLNAALAGITYRFLPTVATTASRFNTSASSSGLFAWWPLPLWKIYAVAAGLMFLQTPYTFAVMMPLNRMMGARGEAIATRVSGYSASTSSSSSSSKRRSASGVSTSSSDRTEREAADRVEYYAVREGELTSHAVVDRWGLTNLFRPVVTLVAAGVGAYAAIW